MKISSWSQVRLACWVVCLAAGMVWAGRPQDSNPSAGKHRFGFLDRSGYESRQSAQAFHELELSDRIVYARQRTVAGAGVEALVQGDHVAYHFDRDSGRLQDFRVHWRDDIPDILPEVIDKAGAEAMALDRAEEERIARRLPGTKRNLASVRYSGLYYLKHDSEMVVQHPAPNNPCWIVETEQAGTISAVVIDAVDGRIVGQAVPPPASGFAFTGPVDISGCSSGWFSWYGNARDWFNKMGYTSEAVQYPDQAKMTEEIQSMRNTLFYELAHGGSYGFTNGCNDSTSPSEVSTWLSAIPAVPFTFLGSCDGMCSTGSGTLSNAFRKGLAIGTSTVGYCGMSNEPCITSCWYSGDTIPWQTRLFEMLNQGRTVKEAFDAANADYPGCSSPVDNKGNPKPPCMRFAGDPSLRLVAPITRSGLPGRIYVDANAVGANDGTDWDDAFVSLSDAIDAAYRGVDIWVAQGEYRPKTDGPARNAAFQLKDDVYIYGGFVSGATSWTQRDPTKYPTVLSGDLGNNDTVDPLTRNDNSYHVIVATNLKDVLLDGLVITGGNADGTTYEQQYGGGMYCTNSRVSVRDCVIQDNISSERGGGVFVWQDSQPTLDRCRLLGNSSGVLGGGMASYGPTILLNCEFEGNQSQFGGGLWGTVESITGCRFANNVSSQNGGGVYAIANMTIENGLFYGNHAASFGGGIYGQDCNVVIRNCTLTGNQANQYGGVYNDAGTTLTLNSILWYNSDMSNDLYRAQIHGWQKPLVEYSCVTGWTAIEGGIGNFDRDPLFINSGGGDFHLQSMAGRWNSSTGKWVYDKQTSRCIDAGSPSMALGLETKDSANLRIDMGCYGGTAEASRTPAGWSLLADMNNDGAVEMEDFAILSGSWGIGNIWPLHPDLTRNGTVDLEDFLLLVESWMGRTTWHP
jgi:predicted outer membrane repeat protein